MCRVSVAVGDVKVVLEHDECVGKCSLPGRARSLFRVAASVALTLEQQVVVEPESRVPLGFSAQVELDPERNVEPDLSEWFEESP